MGYPATLHEVYRDSMKILYYDCSAGISGDMNLAAMIGLGVDLEFLQDELALLGLGDAYSLELSVDKRKGVQGYRVEVKTAEGAHHAHHQETESHHHGRSFADIRELIQGCSLREEIKNTSLAIFFKLAQAEASIHGGLIDEVRFHEVGAVDSIIDIVGAAICYHALGVDEVWAGPVELGGGCVTCEHGRFAVPAPATENLLAGIPTCRGGVQHEATTPTGAAILATLVDTFTDQPRMTVRNTAYGIGHRDTDLPNVLRASLADVAEDASSRSQAECLLECNIDDMTAEMLGVVMDTLMEHGAKDVHFTPIIMKKNRPATMLSLLCSQAEEDRFAELLFRHTTTNGIKKSQIRKTTLETTYSQVETPLGIVSIKHALLKGKIVHSKPELEDCRELAIHNKVPLMDVYRMLGQYLK